MSKNKKKAKVVEQEVVAPAENQEAQPAEESQEEVLEQLEVQMAESIEEIAKIKPQPVEQKISLHDACRRFVIGYKEFWLPSIKKFAKSEGYDDLLTIEEARSVLGKWGAKLF